MAPRDGKPSNRPLKVGEELRHCIAEVLMRGELHDPALDASSITVSEVRISPDLKNATVFVLPLGGRNSEAVVQALAGHAAHIRHLVARKVRMRHVPNFRFMLDATFERASVVQRLLADPNVRKDIVPDSAAGADEE